MLEAEVGGKAGSLMVALGVGVVVSVSWFCRICMMLRMVFGLSWLFWYSSTTCVLGFFSSTEHLDRFSFIQGFLVLSSVDPNKSAFSFIGSSDCLALLLSFSD